MTFDEWMKEVDQQVILIVECSVHDLADQPFRDWFGDGYSARDAAEEALENEGWPPFITNHEDSFDDEWYEMKG